MPRIDAPTVAEHRAGRRRALLDAALTILAEDPDGLTLAAVGRRAGLARPTVYEYFGSREDLLAAVVADVFPQWAARVLAHVDAEATAGARVWAYVEANVELFAGAEQAVARALRRVVDPEVLRDPMHGFHVQLQQPLLAALAELGEPRPEEAAELVNALVLRAAATLDAPDGGLDHDEALALLRRILAPYLGLPG